MSKICPLQNHNPKIASIKLMLKAPFTSPATVGPSILFPQPRKYMTVKKSECLPLMSPEWSSQKRSQQGIIQEHLHLQARWKIPKHLRKSRVYCLNAFFFFISHQSLNFRDTQVNAQSQISLGPLSNYKEPSSNLEAYVFLENKPIFI